MAVAFPDHVVSHRLMTSGTPFRSDQNRILGNWVNYASVEDNVGSNAKKLEARSPKSQVTVRSSLPKSSNVASKVTAEPSEPVALDSVSTVGATLLTVIVRLETVLAPSSSVTVTVAS